MRGGFRRACYDLSGMPELPDVTAYISALEPRIIGQSLQHVRLASPFLLRTADPTIGSVEGHVVREMRRVGKRIAIGLDGDLWLVLHLMIAGRLHWRTPGATLAGRNALAAFDFPGGSLVLTEAGSKRRASLHLFRGEDSLAAIDPGGIDVFASDLAAFPRRADRREPHPQARAHRSALRERDRERILRRDPPRGEALAGEAHPFARRRRMAAAVQRDARDAAAVDRPADGEAEAGFPEKVTAFRKDMAVHGRFGEPCPVCGAPIQRIRYADNDTNYCARCQTDGKVLADRSLSRLLGSDWPRNIDELESLKRR